MGTRRASDHEKRTRVQHHVKDTRAARELMANDPEIGGKLALAHKFAERRLKTFAEEIPQAFMVRFFGKEQMMEEKVLPQEEPGEIPWEGGEQNKGDEPGETPDPHSVEQIASDAEAKIIDSEKLEEHAEDEDDF